VTSPRLDVAVVGAGIVGLAAADALRARGADVGCFEAALPGSGQSAGLARSFRHAHEDERLVDLAIDAREGWRAWEERFGRRLLGDEGHLLAGPTAAEQGERLLGAGLDVHQVDEREQPRVLPILAPGMPLALFDPAGGSIRARRAVELSAAALGDRLIRAEVLGVAPKDDRTLVETTEGIWRAERVLVCAGARTAELAASVGVRVPVSTSCHARPAFRVRAEHDGRTLACLTDRSAVFGEDVYATPLGTTGLYAVGVGSGDANVPLAPDRLSLADGETMAPAVDRVRRYVERALPGLDPEPVSVRLCHVTKLPWGADAFAAWQAGPVTVFAGHNLFKFAPALGRLLADAVLSDALPPLLVPRRSETQAEARAPANVRV
jgi:sarcosine oxidase